MRLWAAAIGEAQHRRPRPLAVRDELASALCGRNGLWPVTAGRVRRGGFGADLGRVQQRPDLGKVFRRRLQLPVAAS